MLKRFIPVAGALALTLGLLAGCQDSPATSPLASGTASSSVTQSTDPYMTYSVTDGLNDYSDVPSFDQVMSDPSFLAPPPNDPGRGGGDDSTHHGRDTADHGGRGGDDTTHHPPGGPGGPPRDTTHHGRPDTLRHGGPGPDTTNHGGGNGGGPNGGNGGNGGPGGRGGHPPDSLRLRPINYRDIIGQLRLTPAQDSAIRLCFRDFDECTHSAATRYRDALQALHDSLQAALSNIRAAVDAGTITRAEGRARVDALVAQFRHDGAALEAAYRQAVGDCRTAFESCVSSNLTADQLVIWTRLTHR